jgi:hypothetical protein
VSLFLYCVFTLHKRPVVLGKRKNSEREDAEGEASSTEAVTTKKRRKGKEVKEKEVKKPKDVIGKCTQCYLCRF